MADFLETLLGRGPQREEQTLWVMTAEEIDEMTDRQKADWSRDPRVRVIVFSGNNREGRFDKDNVGPPQHAGLDVAGYCNSLDELQKMIGELKEVPSRISISANLHGADIVQLRLLQQCAGMSDDHATDVVMHGSMTALARWSSRSQQGR